jgi:Calcineurin-like phosphoesterase
VTQSSRISAAGAGWEACSGCGAWKADVPADAKPLSWLRPTTLWRSRNDIVARKFHDPVDAARHRWVELARRRAGRDGTDPDFIVQRRFSEPVSFLVAGDTGEGDDSQYAVVPGLISQSQDIDFTVLCSDLNYPTGDSGDFEDRFYLPYKNLPGPLFGLPGNHDWYDGLHGFMHHLCGIDEPDQKLDFGSGARRWLAERFWRRAPGVDATVLASMKRNRALPDQQLDPPQPAPYMALDTGVLRLILIDTGILGGIDSEQAEWLRRVSFDAERRPKILLTGKPIYVDNEYHPCVINGEPGTVDDIVRDPRANYVAAIGGDIHNYQRYPVRLPDGRTLQYVVNGGGGAFMHATHQIPKVDVGGVDERDFRCYPLRGDSLARYSQIYDQKLHTGNRLALSPDEASSYLAQLLGLGTTRPGDPVKLSQRARRAGKFIQPLPATRGFHKFVSEAFDWNTPPMFKSFLRLDATHEEVRVRCFGVSGCRETEHSPPVEDEFVIRL